MRQAIIVWYRRLNRNSECLDYDHDHETFDYCHYEPEDEWQREGEPTFEDAQAQALKWIKHHIELDPAKREYRPHRRGDYSGQVNYPEYLIDSVSIECLDENLEAALLQQATAIRDQEWKEHQAKDQAKAEEAARLKAEKKEAADRAEYQRLHAKYGGA